MSAIPANLSRVPNLLSSQLLLASVTRTSVGLLGVQSQLATGKRVERFSDDPIGATTIAILQERLGRTEQRLNNLSLAQGTLDYLDSSLGSASNLILEAKNIASDQIGAQSDTVTRDQQAVVIDGMLRTLLTLANSQTNGLYVFGGATATRRPIEELRGGFRYVGQGSGLLTDLDANDGIPITIGGENAIGATSGRLQSKLDMNPGLTADTRLSDLRGGRGLGVAKGSVQFAFNGGPTATVDLSSADTTQDVVDQLTAAINLYEANQGTTVLGPGGVSISGGSIAIDVVPGGPNPQLTFSEVGSGTTARDLGLAQAPFDAAAAAGADLNPKLTLLTPLSAVAGLTLPLESITDIDLSTAETVDDIRNLIETGVPGTRVQINQAGNGFNIYNEVSGPAMSIEEVPGGANTATALGIRTFDTNTGIDELNSGRGVRIVDNQIDPVSGVATTAFNSDFRVTLGNGQAFDVDLRPQDMVDVQSVIDRINDEFNTALGLPPVVGTAPALAAGDFTAGLTDGGNGLAFTQGVTGGPIAVEKLNNSAAALDLGIEGGIYDATSATLVAQDRAAVRVDNLFTALIDLRDALRNDDSSGITLAGEALTSAVDRLAATRALVGVYANRVEQSTRRQEDLETLDRTSLSRVQDLDFAGASIQFNLLRTQLQAAMQSGVQTQSLSLLDFLG